MNRHKQEFLKRIIQTKYCTDKLTHSLKESLNEFIVEEHSEQEYELFFDQIKYVAEELIPVLEKMKSVWTNRAEQRGEVITSEIQQ